MTRPVYVTDFMRHLRNSGHERAGGILNEHPDLINYLREREVVEAYDLFVSSGLTRIVDNYYRLVTKAGVDGSQELIIRRHFPSLA